MPTSASTTFSNITVDPVFNSDDAFASMLDVAIVANATLAAGTVLGEVTATPGTYKAYLSTNTDGSQTAKGILRRAVTTDGSGNITNLSEWGNTTPVASMFTGGAFRTQDLVGLDANALTNLNARLAEGTVTSGIVIIPGA